MELDLDLPPAPLTEYTQWITWHYQQRANGRQTKPPVAPFDGTHNAAVDDSSTWRSYTDACAYHERSDTDTDGLGFVLTETDPLAGIDLDDCYNPETGEIEPWAGDIIETIDSYTEISPSGYGIRIWLLGSLPDESRTTATQLRTVHSLFDQDIPQIEVYDNNRYLTVTGEQFTRGGDGIADRCAAFRDVYHEYVAKSTQDDTDTVDTDVGDSSQFDSNAHSGQLSDQRILDVARNARNSAKFKRLWNHHPSKYPERDDFKLCKILAFYTQDPHQIDRLFRQSHRMRDLWDKQRGNQIYGVKTVQNALDSQDEYYTPHRDRREPEGENE
jgi:putative DNA primase/helicase